MGLRLVTIAFLCSCAIARAADKPSPAVVEFFESKVRPVLVENCYSCHGPKKQMGGLRLDNAESIRKGGDEGPVLVPGDPAKSRMVAAIGRKTETPSPMPPKGPLPHESVAALTEWVKLGGFFPDGAVPEPKSSAKEHWAFQPVRDVVPPSVKSVPDTTNPIDRFLAAKLEAKGFAFSPAADKATLIRRLTFDVIGLPPSAADVEAFVADASPDATAKLVDSLLAMPQYGERWGRYWLDLARYADSKGYVFTEERSYPYAYTYRDYVIRSLNADVPYNRFVLEQLAADKLPDATPQALAGMGFLTVGRRFSNNPHDIIDDRIDLVTRGLLGLTVACARCHDHKYDPIPAKDYYALYGVFASSFEPKDLPLLAVEKTPETVAFEKELARREAELVDATATRTAGRLAAAEAFAGTGLASAKTDRLLNRADNNKFKELQQKIDRFKSTSPAAPPRAMVMNDLPRPVEPVVFLRGNPGNRGPQIPRQSPEILRGPTNKPYTQGSGRLELARAIVAPDNPLTARVIVNRVWAYHFGSGFVKTPSDFGVRTEAPSHPELLDWLAKNFTTVDGWSLKKLHRRILLSRAYQQSSLARADVEAIDPENRLFARQNRKRHDFEALRDSMLAAAGTLDASRIGGKSVDLFKAPFSHRRTAYALIDRQNLAPTLRAFDAASPDQHTPVRFQTTIPQQALFLMNSPFVAEQARAAANRPDVRAAKTPAAKADAVFRIVLSRKPSPAELTAATEFVASVHESKDAVVLGPWEQLAQVLLLGNEFAFVD